MSVKSYTLLREDSFYCFDQVSCGRKTVPLDRSVQLPYNRLIRRLVEDKSVGVETGGQNYTYWQELGYTPRQVNANGSMQSTVPREWQLAYNRAYSKFTERVTSRLSGAVILAERASTMRMVGSRVGQVLQAYRALRKGRFRKFLELLGIKPKKRDSGRLRNRPQQASSLWLEYWFGWSPLVGDVYSGVELYGQPIPPITVRAGSSQPIDLFRKVSSGSYTASTTIKGSTRVHIRGNVRVSNPSLFEANRWGFLNPGTIIWELIPFSFLADWFFNIGQVIQSYTDWVGLTLSDGAISWVTEYRSVYDSPRFGSPTKSVYRVKEVNQAARYVTNSLPKPRLTMTLPGFSLTRIATSLSLLVQLLSK